MAINTKLPHNRIRWPVFVNQIESDTTIVLYPEVRQSNVEINTKMSQLLSGGSEI